MEHQNSIQITMDGILGADLDRVTITVGRRAPVVLVPPSVVLPAPAVAACPPADTEGMGARTEEFTAAASSLYPELLAGLSTAGCAWLRQHPKPAAQVICALVEFAAAAEWPDSDELLEAPWARELVTWLSTTGLKNPRAITPSRDIVAAFQTHLAGKAPWPGDLHVQRALRTILYVKFGAQVSHDAPGDNGCIRGYRGVELSPRPPFDSEKVAGSHTTPDTPDA